MRNLVVCVMDDESRILDIQKIEAAPEQTTFTVNVENQELCQLRAEDAVNRLCSMIAFHPGHCGGFLDGNA